MALPDYSRLQDSTAVVFADTTDYAAAAANNFGTRTDQLDLTSVAAGAARQSAKADLGATRAEVYDIYAAIEWATAPADTENVAFYWAPSPNSTAASANVGGTTGSDSAYTGYNSNLTDSLKHLMLLGVMPCTVDATGTVQAAYIGQFSPPNRYGAVVVVNNSAADAFMSDAVEMSVALIPVEGVTEDT